MSSSLLHLLAVFVLLIVVTAIDIRVQKTECAKRVRHTCTKLLLEAQLFPIQFPLVATLTLCNGIV